MKQVQYAVAIVDLPPGIVNQLEIAMNDEFEIARRKWGIYPDSEMRQYIFEQSWTQLSGKVEKACGFEWDFTDFIKVKIFGMGAGYIRLPAEADRAKDVRVIREKDKWELHDGNDAATKAYPLNELETRIVKMLHDWVRTAVFYGVGSVGER